METIIRNNYKFKRNKLGRIGIIDVGSNSVRLVVFDGFSRSPNYFFNEKVLCGLGRGMSKTKLLNRSGKIKTIQAVKRFVAITKKMSLTELVGVATAAIRNSVDGETFIKKLRKDTGLVFFVASGNEEANFSANGVLLGWPDADGIVCDIGGGSLELANVENELVTECGTSLLGPLVLSDFKGSQIELTEFIAIEVKKLCSKFKPDSKNLYLVGGSFRAFARIDMALSKYPLRVLHEYKILANQAVDTANWIITNSVEDLSKLTDSSFERLSLLELTSRVLLELIFTLKPTNVYFSSYGLREGILFSQMPEKLKKLDPLIEACREQEKLTARFPGFGECLFAWILPIFSHLNASDNRLFYAACLLHDTTWKAHPDYRAEMSFETVTRSNLGGIDHQGRIFLALALMSRYKKISYDETIRGSLKLLKQDRCELAISLGRAMRLGAMVSGSSITNLKKSKISIKNGVLCLLLKKSGVYLSGDTVETRLKALAKSLKMEAIIERVQ